MVWARRQASEPSRPMDYGARAGHFGPDTTGSSGARRRRRFAATPGRAARRGCCRTQGRGASGWLAGMASQDHPHRARNRARVLHLPLHGGQLRWLPGGCRSGVLHADRLDHRSDCGGAHRHRRLSPHRTGCYPRAALLAGLRRSTGRLRHIDDDPLRWWTDRRGHPVRHPRPLRRTPASRGIRRSGRCDLDLPHDFRRARSVTDPAVGR